MNDHKSMRFYLEPALCESALAGKHNFISRMAKVLRNAQFRVDFLEMSASQKENSPGYSLIHMKQPIGPDGLVFRRVYQYPFWQIETTHERWNWEVAKARFEPDALKRDEADQFYRFWQKRLFDDATNKTKQNGLVYVPLQGRLKKHRSFQKCSPVRMVEHCLEYDSKRKIIATLHPKESYSNEELDTLEKLERRHARLEIRMGQMVNLLQECDYVVTQNSSAAFSGFFFGKPAMLFADIDFHHIAVKADMGRLDASFADVEAALPDYAKYIWWFWQSQSINAGRPDAEAKIAARLGHLGWPMA